MNNNSILISVIVPVYNVENYIHECIDSIIAQTHNKLEIIIVDDGSTDASGKICDSYLEKDSRIIVIHKENGGLSDARNVGIEQASGDYLSFVDSDDWIAPNMLESLLNSCLKNDSDISVCGVINVFKDNQFALCPKKHTETTHTALKLLLDNREIADRACDKLFRRSLWDNISFPKGKTYEDIRTIYKLFLKAENVTFIDEPLYFYRQRRGSIARSKFNPNKMEWLEAVRELTTDSVLSKDNEYLTILKERELHTKCYLLREILITVDNNDAKSLKLSEELYEDVRNNRFHIIKLNRYSKSIKIMAFFSTFGFKIMKSVLNNKFYSKYFDTRYKYYE